MIEKPSSLFLKDSVIPFTIFLFHSNALFAFFKEEELLNNLTLARVPQANEETVMKMYMGLKKCQFNDSFFFFFFLHWLG